MKEFCVVVVGGGPMCTYALERLAALLPHECPPGSARVTVFERTGRFGAGEAHSDLQPATSYMNRVAGQIALAADESNLPATRLLPAALRPTFHEWCRARFERTGDPRFDLGPRDVPRRWIHGLALREAFDRYAAVLRAAGFAVDTRAAEVTDLSPGGEGGAAFTVHAADGTAVPADHVLCVTGHPRNASVPGSTTAPQALGVRRAPRAGFVEYPYPLEARVTEAEVPPGSVVGVHGMGLTGIDVFLHLTEGRGGRFVEDGPGERLRYLPSGREPARIVAFGPSGAFTTCRPDNAKQGNPSLEHRGVFFTVDAVRALRDAAGTPSPLPGGVRQLDFDLHLLPLVVLEMASVYYGTLFGAAFGEHLRLAAGPRYRRFLRRGRPTSEAAIKHLLEPVQRCFDAAAAYVCCVERGEPPPEALRTLGTLGVVEGFHATVYGTGGNGAPRWGHPADVHAHRFDWRRILDPLSADDAATGEEWAARVRAFMERDIAGAAQGNRRNPVKAACDGVWRDLRAELSAAADRGGFTAPSHQRFMAVHLRYYNRLSNGAGVEPMRKVLALIDSGVLDVSTGPFPKVAPLHGAPGFRVTGSRTGVVHDVGVVVDARLHSFDPALDARPMYPNLLRRGLVRKWVNPGPTPADDFVPGGLDLSEGFHPVRADGTVEPRLTFLGVPTEGVLFFQASAAKPGSNSYVLNNVARWANEMVRSLAAPPNGPWAHAGAAEPPSPCITTVRDRVREIVAREARGARRHVVMLAVDGIPCALARRTWRHARTSPMRSVFPATSSTAWLSALTGLTVDEHGVPGVVFRVEEGAEPVQVLEHRGPLLSAPVENVFSDARRLGFIPVAVAGDLEDFDCAWRALLLAHACRVDGFRFFADGAEEPEPAALVRRLSDAVAQALQHGANDAPCLVWCFVDVDRYVHRHGYDARVLAFLEGVDEAAAELAADGTVVVAHSDHGLTPTRHDPDLEALLEEARARHGFAMGGAGRVRWLYPTPGTTDVLRRELGGALPPGVELASADEWFTPGSLAHGRVGPLLLVARGEAFLAPAAYRYEHGSATPEEMEVPFAEWGE